MLLQPLCEQIPSHVCSHGSEFQDENRSYHPLHGVIGTLHLPTRIGIQGGYQAQTQEHNRVQFRNHTSQEVGDISIEPLTVDGMFWLAVGCLVAPANRIYSLENVQTLALSAEEPEEEDIVASSPNYKGPTSPAVHFDHTANSYDVDSYRNRPWEDQLSPNTYIVPPSTDENNLRTRNYLGPRAFKFTETHDRSEALSSLARSVEPARRNMTIFPLEEVDLSDEEREALQRSSETTYVSSESMWTRLTSAPHPGAWFLNRSDGQILAQALLRLPICPQGYLVNSNKGSVLRTALCGASDSLPQLLVRMVTDIESLALEPADRVELVAAMNQLIARTLKYEYSRAFASSLFRLDEILQRHLHTDGRANDAVGVLMITNAEFRSLIAQSARHITNSVNTSVIVDLADSCLVVPTVMGIMQKFSVDLDVLFPDGGAAEPAITIIYTSLLILSLKASLRITFFETSLDSLPLFAKVTNMKEEVAHLG